MVTDTSAWLVLQALEISVFPTSKVSTLDDLKVEDGTGGKGAAGAGVAKICF